MRPGETPYQRKPAETFCFGRFLRQEGLGELCYRALCVPKRPERAAEGYWKGSFVFWEGFMGYTSRVFWSPHRARNTSAASL